MRLPRSEWSIVVQAQSLCDVERAKDGYSDVHVGVGRYDAGSGVLRPIAAIERLAAEVDGCVASQGLLNAEMSPLFRKRMKP